MIFEFLRRIFPQRVPKETVDLLIACFDRLDDPRFERCTPQLKAGLLRFQGKNEEFDPGFVRFTYFPHVSGKFQDRKGRWIRISGIKARSKVDGESDRLRIELCWGLVIGYGFERDPGFKPHIASIDVTAARVEYLDTPDKDWARLIPDALQPLINWADVFEVELDGKVYFHLKDIGDGDFLGIDNSRTLYEIRHDPYEIRRLTGDLKAEFEKYE